MCNLGVSIVKHVVKIYDIVLHWEKVYYSLKRKKEDIFVEILICTLNEGFTHLLSCHKCVFYSILGIPSIFMV